MLLRPHRQFRTAVIGVALAISTFIPAALAAEPGKGTQMQEINVSRGYAPAAEGLEVYYEVHGEGEPIVVLAGGLSRSATWHRSPGRCPGRARS